MQGIRELRSRIKSISGTAKIIKAMEMVSSSRIRKAQTRILEARPFMNKIEAFISELSVFSGAFLNPLTKSNDDYESVIILGITSDRGLCGSYNSNMIRHLEKRIEYYESLGKKVQLWITGIKGKNYFRYIGRNIEKSYDHLSDYPKFFDAREICNDFIDEYLEKRTGRVELNFTKYNGLFEQKPVTRQVIPLPLEKMRERLYIELGITEQINSFSKEEFLFEPSSNEVMLSLVSEYINTLMYTALLESTASEIAARMTAMKSASDSAEKMKKLLNNKYHRARQQQITIEISEIASGADALINL